MLRRRTLVGGETQPQFTLAVVDPVEPMRAPGQTDPISLETVPQTWLRDPTARIQVIDQRQQVGDVVRVHVLGETGRNSAEQQTA